MELVPAAEVTPSAEPTAQTVAPAEVTPQAESVAPAAEAAVPQAEAAKETAEAVPAPQAQNFVKGQRGRRDRPYEGTTVTPQTAPTNVRKVVLLNALEPGEIRVAILENNELAEIFMERKSRGQQAGNIYKGRVVNVEPSLQAAFVDLGAERNGFLHASDCIPPDGGFGDVLVKPPPRGDRRGKGQQAQEAKAAAQASPAAAEAPTPVTAPAEGEAPASSAETLASSPDAAPSVDSTLSSDASSSDPAPATDPTSDASPTEISSDAAATPAGDETVQPSAEHTPLIAGGSQETAVGQPHPAAPQSQNNNGGDRKRRRRRRGGRGRSGRGRVPGPAPMLAPKPASPQPENGQESAASALPVQSEPPQNPLPSVEAEEEDDNDTPETEVTTTSSETPSPEPTPVPAPAEPQTSQESQPSQSVSPEAGEAAAPASEPREAPLETSPEAPESSDEPEPEIVETEVELPAEGHETVQTPEPPPEDSTETPVSETDAYPTEGAAPVEPELETNGVAEAAATVVSEGEQPVREAVPIPAPGQPPPAFTRPERKDRGGRSGRERPHDRRYTVQEMLREGQEVLVQVAKEGIGQKGPALTTYLSMPGRYLVLMPAVQRLGVSKRIDNEEQRRALKDALNSLNAPEDMGVIVRTAGTGKSKEELQRDLDYLMHVWDTLKKKAKMAKAPALIFQEGDIVTRVFRDVITDDVAEIIIDDSAVADRAREYLRETAPGSEHKIKVHDGPDPLFHKYGVEQQLQRLFNRKVNLRSGGSIVIEQTEALVAIDVNTGRFREKRNQDDTILQTNLEAAREIARQLRLRDIGGLVMIDFIDMEIHEHRRRVERELKAHLARDKARINVLPVSSLGVVEMTRQRIRHSLRKTLFDRCPHCSGSGHVKSAESLGLEMLREIKSQLRDSNVRRIKVLLNSGVAFEILNQFRKDLVRLEEARGITIEVRGDANVPLSQIQVSTAREGGEWVLKKISEVDDYVRNS
jgi:ribonuclease E